MGIPALEDSLVYIDPMSSTDTVTSVQEMIVGKPDLRPPTPFDMIQSAIAQGFNAEQLGKILDLQERMESGQAFKAFSEAMNAAQKAMPVVVRDAQNTFTKSRYAKLETVTAKIKPIYTEHGFSLSFGEGKCDREGFCHIYCDVSHVGGHCKRYEAELPIDKAGAKGNDNKSAIQAVGSTFSYSRRYLTLMIFNITIADEDNDGNPSESAVGPKQIEEINGLIDDLRKAGKPVEFNRFLEWMKVKSLDELTLAGYAKAVHELNRRKAPAKAAARAA